MKSMVWLFKPIVYVLLAACALQALLSAILQGRPLLYAHIGITIAAALFVLLQLRHIKKDIKRFLMEMGQTLTQSQQDALTEFPIPVMLTNKKGEVIWYNELFQRVALEGGDIYGGNIGDIVPNIDIENLAGSEGYNVEYRDKMFTVFAVRPKDTVTSLCVFYFIDDTRLKRLASEYEESRPSVGIIMIDNCEELLQTAREDEGTQLMGKLEYLLFQYAAAAGGMLRKLERDKYLMVVEERGLRTMMENRFDILDKVREVTVGEGQMPATLSIGLGHDAADLRESEQMARQALEMALGRGGDQAAVRTANGYEFFGGISKGVEKRTKVKTRIVASALMELINTSDNVMLMGHNFADLDCMGSAVGLCKGVRMLGKPASIVLKKDHNLAQSLYERLCQNGYADAFLDPSMALGLITKKTLLIIVDTHIQHILESEEVYRACKNVVVIDHHRKMVGHIDRSVIFYHEPYASSASEMVTELLQYFGADKTIGRMEAEALLAGIMLDTRNFVLRTGVRTFEAAAYLRKLGADTVEVRKLFASSMESYQRKTQLVAAAEVYRGCAVAMAGNAGEDIKLVAPQAADELLAADRSTLDSVELQWIAKCSERDKLKLESAVETNRKLEMLGILREKVAVLLDRKDYIAEQKQRLEFIRGAQQVSKTDDILAQISKQIEEYREEMQEAQARLPQLTRTMQSSQLAVVDAKNREETKRGLIARRAALEQASEAYQKVANFRAELTVLEQQRETHAARERRLSVLRERAGLLGQLRILQQQQENLEHLAILCNQHREKNNSYHMAKDQYLLDYDRFLSAQAGILAQALRSGLPCPVCGSTEHPFPAHRPADVPTQAALDEARSRLDELAAEAAILDTDIRTCHRQINYIDTILSFREEEAVSHLNDIVLEKAHAEDHIERLNVRLDEMDAQLGLTDEQYDDEVFVLEEIASLQGRIVKVDAEVEAAKRRIDELSESFSGFRGGEQGLARELSALSEQITAIDAEIAANTQHYIEAKSEYDTLCKTIEHARTKQFNLNNQKNLTMNQFTAELNQNRFATRDMYREYREQIPQADELEAIIHGYQVACSTATAEMNTLDMALKGKKPANVEALSVLHGELTVEIEALERRKVALSARIQINRQAAEAIRSRFEGMAKLYLQYKDLSELHRLASGNNAQRISFESYVLSSYFDDIIALANVRLAKMTGERYELRRRTEREKFGRSSGLSLEITDYYSGKARHISTLSGGESFKTALALALSLADIVQMYAGGVCIDTMFIDEGFGSLDEASLDSAVKTLTSLGEDGRVVGIISHVAELKERIPSRIAVHAGRGGSHCDVIL